MREIELWRTSMLADVGAPEPIGPVMRAALSLAISAVFEAEGVEQFVDDKPTLFNKALNLIEEGPTIWAEAKRLVMD